MIQYLFPALVGSPVGFPLAAVRRYHLKLGQRGKRLAAVGIDACTDACALGGTHRAVGIVELDGSPADTCQRVSE